MSQEDKNKLINNYSIVFHKYINHINKSIISKKKINRPCIIQNEKDIKNIINITCNLDKKNITEILSYNEIKKYNDGKYNDGKHHINNNEQIETIEDILKLGKYSNDLYYKKETDKLKIMKFMGINISLFNKIRNTFKPLKPEQFWIEIAKQKYLSRNENYINNWCIDPDYIIHIIQSDEYIKKYTFLNELLEPYINNQIQLNSGIIHHIIFKGELLYNYIIESPDYALFILNENQHYNIPKFLIRLM
jgi:hypothetical protein